MEMLYPTTAYRFESLADRLSTTAARGKGKGIKNK